MDTKDIYYIIGIIATAILSILNLVSNIKNNKKTIFINTVTSERVKWLDKLRANISNYTGLADTFTRMKKDDYELGIKILDEMSKLQNLIKLQLSPNEDNVDGKIQYALESIFDKSVKYDRETLKTEIDNLIVLSQKLLKIEWEKVKNESESGNLNK